MTRPALFRWSLRWARGALALAAAFVAVLAIVNAVDAFPFRRAVRKAQGLSVADLQALADACERYEQGGHRRWEGLDAPFPPEFQALKPVRVSIYPGCSDISLFERGDAAYVFLRVRTTASNQDVTYVSSGFEGQHNVTLWQRSPAESDRLRFRERLVTLSQVRHLDSWRTWVVRPNAITVINGDGRAGTAPQIAAHFPLSAAQRRALEDAVIRLPAEVRGHAFDAGAMDGVSLLAALTPDGEAGPNDIVLNNAWRVELQPLLDAVNAVTGPSHAIAYPEWIAQQARPFDDRNAPPSMSIPLQEYNRRMNWLPTPWWCFWPYLELGALSERRRIGDSGVIR